MRNLFHPLSPDLRRDLETVMRAIEAGTPLSAAHAKELPYAVRDLSRLLTQERSLLSQPYWASPRLLAAYCRYFLPWNLVRLAHLLPGLGLSLAPGATVLDLGSGPLTLPLALWLTYPQWRDMPLTVICNDVAPKPMQVGRDIFCALTGGGNLMPKPHPSQGPGPWRIELRRGLLDATLRGLKGTADLITAGNVLNEIPPGRESPLEERLAELANMIAARLAPGGRFLAVEPGNRLGGKLMALTRRGGLAAGLLPLSPCPHQGPCPMLVPSAPGKKPTGWCHFSYPAHGENAPGTLLDLTRRAKLEKNAFSLSCLLLRPAEPGEGDALGPPPAFADLFDDSDYSDTNQGEDGPAAGAEAFVPPRGGWPKSSYVRILSDPIRLPDREEPTDQGERSGPVTGRYACSERGLALVLNAPRIPSGAALQVRWPEEDGRDLKTGALLAPLAPVAPPADGRGRPEPRPRRNDRKIPPPQEAPKRSEPGRKKELRPGKAQYPKPGGRG